MPTRSYCLLIVINLLISLPVSGTWEVVHRQPPGGAECVLPLQPGHHTPPQLRPPGAGGGHVSGGWPAAAQTGRHRVPRTAAGWRVPAGDRSCLLPVRRLDQRRPGRPPAQGPSQLLGRHQQVRHSHSGLLGEHTMLINVTLTSDIIFSQMRHRSMSLVQAIREVKSTRDISPNRGFLKQLVEYENKFSGWNHLFQDVAII